MIKSVLTALCWSSITNVALAERFVLHNLYQNGELPYFENEHGHRFMTHSHQQQQQQVVNRFLQGNEAGAAQGGLIETGTRLDINQTANTCQTTAFEITCNVASVVSAADNTFSDLAMTVKCELESQNAFDFRFAKNCACGVAATDANGKPKNCFCTVCPAGFGPNPISIECVDDFIIGECTSLDCDFACNGTCSFDCANSGPDCKFCEDNPFAPTVAPTGTGERTPGRPTLLGPSGGAPPVTLVGGIVALIMGLYVVMA